MLTPDDIAQRRFLVSLRGFDRDEVTTFLREVGDEVRRLRTRIAELEADVARRQRAEQQGDPDPDVALRSLGQETTRILVAAEESAREIETKATARAQNTVEKAEREAREATERANRQAARTIAEAERRRDQVAAEIQGLREERDHFVAGLRASVATIGGVVGGLGDEEQDATSTEAPPADQEPAPGEAPAATGEGSRAVEEAAARDEPTVAEPAPEDEPAEDEPAAAAPDDTDEDEHTEAAVAVDEAPAEPTVRSRRDDTLRELRTVMGRQSKRALQDVQNEVLASIREHGRGAELDDLLPADADLEPLGETGEKHLGTAYAEAVGDAAAAVDGEAPDGLADGARVHAAAATFRAVLAHEVTSALRATLRAGLEADEPEPQLSERVGEIFRDLRGPVLEATVDEHLSRTYGHGLLDAWEQLGIPAVRWEVGQEARCPENRCRANGGEGAVALGRDFPSGDRVPPAHPGCTCVVVPSDE